jgi:hypothetical protein
MSAGWWARLWGGRAAGGEAPLRTRFVTYRAGRLEAALTGNAEYATLAALPNGSWLQALGGTRAAPLLLTRAEVSNPTSAGATFRLGLLGTSGGTPAAGQAFLAWDTAVGANAVWSWEGAIPLIDGYLYARGGAAGLALMLQYEALTV